MPEFTNHMDQGQSAVPPRPALETGIQCWSVSPDPFKSAGFGVDTNRRGTARSLERRALKWNRFAALSLCGRIDFYPKPVPTFGSDALARDAIGPKVAAQIEIRTDIRVWP